tara:strand:+ start:12272 stop:12565 length:294 start_codon:yes stop_codon:yes gene_type:complete
MHYAESMDKLDFIDFLDKKISMTDVYQPVAIKELLLHERSQTKAERILPNARTVPDGNNAKKSADIWENLSHLEAEGAKLDRFTELYNNTSSGLNKS